MTRENLVSRWHQYLNSGTYASDAERKNNARYWVRNQMESNLKMPYRWWRDSHISNLNQLKKLAHNRKSFAKSFAIAVQNDDVDYALELANENRNARILRNPSETLHSKFGGCYSTCDDCDTIAYDDGIYSVNDGDRYVCETCLDSSYHWSDYHDCYVDDDYDESEREFENKIGRAHV